MKLNLSALIKRVAANGIAVLLISHNLPQVYEICDRVVVLRDGKCLRVSPPSEIFEASTSMVLKHGVYDSSK